MFLMGIHFFGIDTVCA